jgi:hypothetical protein
MVEMTDHGAGEHKHNPSRGDKGKTDDNSALTIQD